MAETSTLVSFVAAGLGVALVPDSVQHLGSPARSTGPSREPATVELAVAKRARDDSAHIARILARAERLLGEGAAADDGLSGATGGPAAPA
ncbi:hypothetical protein [Knoellia sp. GCM10027209]|uniref:hypothetical protein n=1 Tax=Knoellia sp. GCM10027209 TaxID=3273396 RepID=UPI0036136631